jgi:hypothetical protein
MLTNLKSNIITGVLTKKPLKNQRLQQYEINHFKSTLHHYKE